jgi:serine protease Do
MRRTATTLGLLTLLALAVPAGADGEREARRSPVVRVVEKAREATVAIHTTELVPQYWFGSGIELPDQKREGLGSGTVFHPAGFIVTNAHVVSRASKVLVDLTDATGASVQREARIVVVQVPNDLAILQILPAKAGQPETYPWLALGHSNDLMLGESVIAVGTPFDVGLRLTVTSGIVSGLNRKINLGEAGGPVFEDFIQIDAAVNPGNSGGPLFDITGRWIGVTTAILNRYRLGAEGIGFAIPADRVRKLIGEAFTRRVVSGEWLGLDEVEGVDGVVSVNFVFPKGPARDSGLKKGDVVVSAAGKPTPTLFDYRLATADLPVGSVVELGVSRDGRPLRERIRVAMERVPTDHLSTQHLGVLVADVDEEVARRARLPMDSGVLVREVRPGSPASRIDMKPWDLLVGLGGKRIRNSDELLLFLQYVRPGDVVEVRVNRARETTDGRRRWQEIKGRLVAE